MSTQPLSSHNLRVVPELPGEPLVCLNCLASDQDGPGRGVLERNCPGPDLTLVQIASTIDPNQSESI